MQQCRAAWRRAALSPPMLPLLLLLLTLTPRPCGASHPGAGATSLTPAAVALSADGAGPANASAGRCPAWHTENATRWRLVCGSRTDVEPPHSGEHSATHVHHPRGHYACACCGHVLFPGGAKFDAGNGWPSFWGASGPEALALSRLSPWPRHVRAKVACPVCGAHLGTAFRGGPPPSGTRITVASACLHHEPGAHHHKQAYDPMTGHWYESKHGPKGPKQGFAKRFGAGMQAMAKGGGGSGAALRGKHPHLLDGDMEALWRVLTTGPVGLVLKLAGTAMLGVSAVILVDVCGGGRAARRRAKPQRRRRRQSRLQELVVGPGDDDAHDL